MRAAPVGRPRGCRKVWYASEEAANAELEHARKKAAAGNARRRECRAYFHSQCAGWHLTSKEKRAE